MRSWLFAATIAPKIPSLHGLDGEVLALATVMHDLGWDPTGAWADFQGPDRTVPAGILTWDEYNAIVKAYPRLGLMGELKEVMCGLCKTKPATTYDNTVGEWGEMFVEGYSRDGHRTAEMLLSCDLDERVV
ncbi:hypothetical protein SLS57_002546 [Botryosphaeria dothidea]